MWKRATTKSVSARHTAGSSPGRLRVLLVGKGAPERGGIPTFIDTLAEGLERHHDVRFLNLTRDEVPEGGRFSLSNVRKTLGDMRRVWKESSDFDIVHLHSALAPTVTIVRAGLLALAARGRGARVVVHGHGGMIERWYTTGIRRLMARLALAPAGLVVAVSNGGFGTLEKLVDPARVRLVDNGVDQERFSPAGQSHQPPRLLYAGVLTPRKGLVDLLDASDLLVERGADHELWLVGGMPDEGPEAEAEVRSAVSRRGDRIHMVGRLSPAQMPEAYAEGDIFCLPSWWEAMPLSLLEAMAASLPVVATAVGDIGRVVVEGTTGFVVAPRRPNDLANAIEPLLRDRELRVRLGAAGRGRVEQVFAADRMVGRMASLYQELADS
jgi:glycosyltransferase involved in cell wall biosynthesis